MILLGGSRPRLTSSQQPTSNEEMPDHDADADVIAAGPEPGRRPPWPGGLVWLIVLAETVALAVAVTAAVHYRAQARAPHPARVPAATVTTSLPLPEITKAAV